MNRNSWALALALLATMAAGCIQDQKVLKLQRDGSGTLVEEVYMSPQVTGMMEQMAAGMAEGLKQGGVPVDAAKAKTALDPLEMFKSDIEKRTAELGSDVKLVSQLSKTNAQGWKGYVVTYRFNDITKLNLKLTDQKKDDNAEPGKAKGEPLRVTFRKTPRPMVSFQQAPAPQAAEAPAKPEEAGAAAKADNAMPAAMMSAMLQGMRMSFIVEVDGKIVNTTSHYRQGNNRIVLLDLPMDKVLGNAAGAKLLEGGKDDPRALDKMRELKIEGLAIEDLSKGLVIEWQ